jgi:hypothetical protein
MTTGGVEEAGCLRPSLDHLEDVDGVSAFSVSLCMLRAPTVAKRAPQVRSLARNGTSKLAIDMRLKISRPLSGGFLGQATNS